MISIMLLLSSLCILAARSEVGVIIHSSSKPTGDILYVKSLYSFLPTDGTEYTSNYVALPMEDGRKLRVKMSLSHKDDLLRMRFYSRVEGGEGGGGDYNTPFRACINIHKLPGSLESDVFTANVSTTFSTSHPDSPFTGLLTRTFLMDPSNKFYDRNWDDLAFSIPYGLVANYTCPIRPE